ncbi:helix-turn-helix domain-containing protein [Enterococcus olivae]
MLKILLENQDKTIYQVFCCLQEKNPRNLEEVAFLLKKTPNTLQRILRSWTQDPLNRSTGVGFYLANSQIKGIYAKEHAQLFISILLHRSASFQLLNKLLLKPYCTAVTAQHELHIGMSTFQRRVKQLRVFLASYDLELSFRHLPALKGEEAHIRWLAFQLSLITDPPVIPSTAALFHRYQEISEQRTRQGFFVQDYCQKNINQFFTPRFQLNERGLLFLWKQLLGVEPIWANMEIDETLSFALHAHTLLSEFAIKQLQPQLHRLHCLATLFPGELQSLSGFTVTNEVQLLTQSFCRLLPDYETLLKKHPELPFLYQQLFTHYRDQEDIMMVSED